MASRWDARPPSWTQFAAWLLCGASGALVLLAAFAFGPLAVVPAVLFAVLAVRLGGANISAIGTAAGAGAWGIVLAWPAGQESLWPLFLASAVVVVIAVVVFEFLRRRPPRTTSG